ncbi:MAG: hypothetical protein R2784_09985 [Saprospiraceae bacterium]
MKKPDDFDFLEAVSPSVQWLRESMDINQGQGSSAYFSRFRHPIKGWSPAYPETTGYLIPTLLTYSKISGFEDLKEYSERCLKWLLDIQNPNGWFPALYVSSQNPSVFNSGMILFDCWPLIKKMLTQHQKRAFKNTIDWILNQLDGDFKFIEQGKMAPTYYTWSCGLCRSRTIFPSRQRSFKIESSLRSYSQLIQKTDGFIIGNFQGKALPSLIQWHIPGEDFWKLHF